MAICRHRGKRFLPFGNTYTITFLFIVQDKNTLFFGRGKAWFRARNGAMDRIGETLERWLNEMRPKPADPPAVRGGRGAYRAHIPPSLLQTSHPTRPRGTVALQTCGKRSVVQNGGTRLRRFRGGSARAPD